VHANKGTGYEKTVRNPRPRTLKRKNPGDHVRGSCPVHRCATSSGRSFSANLRLHIYRCFKCGAAGNQLDLYAAVTGSSLFAATVELCERLHREVPWVLEVRSSRPRATDRSTPERANSLEPDRG
jgi:DNA primase